MAEAALFRTKTGQELSGISTQGLAELRKNLELELGLLPIQMAEAAAFSMAMVVRYALGLSAHGGKVGVLAGDCLASWIALATVRHLVNSGCQGHVFVLLDHENFSDDMTRQLKPLMEMNVPVELWNSRQQDQTNLNIIESCHNVISGLFDLASRPTDHVNQVTAQLNELSTPFHTIESPHGINADSGKPAGTPLFASSTLSLGLPLSGLYPGRDYVGRHYVCDTSLGVLAAARFGESILGLFAEQPVVQIFPNLPEEEEALEQS